MIDNVERRMLNIVSCACENEHAPRIAIFSTSDATWTALSLRWVLKA
jgi:hypothetical protein